MKHIKKFNEFLNESKKLTQEQFDRFENGVEDWLDSPSGKKYSGDMGDLESITHNTKTGKYYATYVVWKGGKKDSSKKVVLRADVNFRAGGYANDIEGGKKGSQIADEAIGHGPYGKVDTVWSE